MKKTVCLFSFLLLLLFAGCGSETERQPVPEKDAIDRVSDAASDVGYDGEAIEKNLREMDAATKKHEEDMENIFSE